MGKVMRFTKWHGIAGVVFTLFIVLLLIRLDLLKVSGQSNPAGRLATSEKMRGSDVWMQVLQQGRKIGYVHRTLTPMEGGYAFADEVFMHINTMGVVQGMTFSTRGTLNRDMTLATFHTSLASNMFRFDARGRIVGKTLKVTLRDGQRGEERQYEATLKDIPYTAGNMADMVFAAGLRSGESRTVPVFDPASLGTRPVKITVMGEDVIQIGHAPRKLTKILVEFMGTQQYAWMDQEGQLVREEGTMGLSLERVTEAAARSERGTGSGQGVDVTEWASVAVDAPIQDPLNLRTLKLKLYGIEAQRFALSGDRQSYQNGILTVRKESFRRGDGSGKNTGAENRSAYLRPSPFIQSDHPEIMTALKGIVMPNDDADTKMKKIVHWVYRHLEKQPVLSVSNALETLRNRRGDCTEHAVLTAALARAAGIPATIETGLIYQRSRFYYHAWNVFWIDGENGWVTADAVFDQVPADVTHIRFVRGEMQEQLDLIGLIGRLRLEIIR